MSKSQVNLSSDRIKELQEKLGLAVDGDFGPATKSAIEALGKKKGVQLYDYGPAELRKVGL